MAADDVIPEACTLPDAARPARLQRLEQVLRSDVVAVERESPTRVRLILRPDPAVTARVADLAMREASCCFFLTFDLRIAEGSAQLAIDAQPAHAHVLDELIRGR